MFWSTVPLSSETPKPWTTFSLENPFGSIKSIKFRGVFGYTDLELSDRHSSDGGVRRHGSAGVGRRYTIEEAGRWGSELPRSDIVLIGASSGIDGDALQSAFENCIGIGDESNSPLLKLSKRLFQDEQTSN